MRIAIWRLITAPADGLVRAVSGVFPVELAGSHSFALSVVVRGRKPPSRRSRLERLGRHGARLCDRKLYAGHSAERGERAAVRFRQAALLADCRAGERIPQPDSLYWFAASADSAGGGGAAGFEGTGDVFVPRGKRGDAALAGAESAVSQIRGRAGASQPIGGHGCADVLGDVVGRSRTAAGDPADGGAQIAMRSYPYACSLTAACWAIDRCGVFR